MRTNIRPIREHTQVLKLLPSFSGTSREMENSEPESLCGALTSIIVFKIVNQVNKGEDPKISASGETDGHFSKIRHRAIKRTSAKGGNNVRSSENIGP